MRRIYYLLDDIDEADLISDTLHDNGIADWQFHVLAKDEEGLYRHHLHRANILQKRDVVHSGERGALIGGGVGLYLSMFILPWSISSTTLLLSVLVALTTVGIVIGGLLGNSHENYKISRFHDDLEEGKLLIMLDVKKDQHALVLSHMKHEFPDLESAGDDSVFSNPFKKGRWIHI
ncbi:hypothetical protein A9Q99_16925 [Gammaproteobacteria bacterium 45_16_T64]|nr:hypothetical protein A9Q99_16925 [Gammaproteobacteria bacterium 45_16_T64]